MSYPVYMVPAGDVLPIFFSSYGKTNGESITLSGLAVTDIEIYKDGSTTQRASDAGYTLLDTDGIDFDSITGIHGFSIDTGDNTDAGFYTTGAWFHVVVSAVTVDSQTVSFIAAAFRIVPAESSAGVPKVDVSHLGGSAIDQSGGLINANVKQISGDATAADNLEAASDGTGYNLGGGSVVAASVTAGVTVANGGIASTSFAAGAIDAAAIAADAIGSSELASSAANEIADATLARNINGGSSTGRTVSEALAPLRNKTAIAAGTLTVYDTDDSTSKWTATVATTAGNPISSIDPA
jgi:hypothetical protein